MIDLTTEELYAQLPEGPWGWRGRKEDVMLLTLHSGMIFLMGTDRAGMHGSQFSFQTFSDPTGEKTGKASRGMSHIRTGIKEFYVTGGRDKLVTYIHHPLAELICRLPVIMKERQKLQEKLHNALNEIQQLEEKNERLRNENYNPDSLEMDDHR